MISAETGALLVIGELRAVNENQKKIIDQLTEELVQLKSKIRDLIERIPNAE
jgi:peptidoglycan hydrolase CwlO-like protein